MDEETKALKALWEAIPSELYRRELPDGRALVVEPLAYGRARLGLTNRHCRFVYDEQW